MRYIAPRPTALSQKGLSRTALTWTWLLALCALTIACDDGGGNNNGAVVADAEPIEIDGGAGAGGEGGAGAEGGAPGGAGGEAGGMGGAAGECRDGDVRDCPDDPCGGGTQSCDAGTWGECQWPEDVCNGEDDDCDGRADEDFPELGNPCTEGLGLCAEEGSMVCGPNGQDVQCNVTAGAPSVELCNGEDDDCDGTTDEGEGGNPLTEPCYEGPEGSEGIGTCAGGRRVCTEGAYGACEGQVIPGLELCGEGDEDCDGNVDEGYEQIGEACVVGLGQCTAMGQLACDEMRGALICAGNPLPPGEEQCSGIDEDCDGNIDEGVQCRCALGEERPCYGGPQDTQGIGVCRGGVQTCDDEGIFGLCVGEQRPDVERCDGLDNDCDTRLDEGFPELGQACEQGVGQCRVQGLISCDPNGQGTRCDALPLPPQMELCNELDDDCDGITDEDFDIGGACTVGVGACENVGMSQCDLDGNLRCNVSPGFPGLETCNGIDDDCDGRTDEGGNGQPLRRICYEGPEGSEGQGLCQGGSQACVDGDFGVCEGQVIPVDETCDGLDQDCDGRFDEDFSPGSACTEGLGACAADGVFLCSELGGVICTAQPGEPIQERCNGIDDDCDGVTDEGFEGVGAACQLGIGQCRREGVVVCQPNGEGLRCDAVPAAPSPELCDGEDNDCDGQADEALLEVACYDGPEGTRRVGLCADGRQACVAGAPGLCVGQQGPVDDVCDGEDNDCDGTTDEAQAPCYDGPEGSEGVGQCAPGVRACAGGVPGACIEQVLPSLEICDGVDNDCNGVIDDGVDCNCEPGERRACYGGPEGTEGVGLCQAGTQVCQPQGGFGPCEAQITPQAELCDGEDNDCDGQADENLDGIGADCSTGVGQCRRGGQVVCAPDAGGLSCNATPGVSVDEACNGLDDDCDGQADEGLGLGDACTEGLGICAADGVLQCGEGGAVVCSAIAGESRGETCDGADEDCDGNVDEGGNGQPLVGVCYTGPAGTEGVGLCRGGEALCAEGSLGQCNGQVLPTNERCNGLDEDCDGRIDEGFGVGNVCFAGLGICRDEGTLACNGNGGVACVADIGEPQDETCNGLDDDCDGSFDEGPNGGALTEVCYTGAEGTLDQGLCRAGNRTCAGGAFGQCQNEITPRNERCDEADNDCDGSVDEDFDLGTACIRGLGLCAVEGQLVCDVERIGTTCGGAQGPSPVAELCNGLDDDCDGATDENFNNLGQPCLSGIGACLAQGTFACSAGGDRVVCDAELGQPQPELCNGEDDDCDSFTDENPTDVGQPCFAGVGICAVEGVVQCDEIFERSFCDATPGEPGVETCDGEDDDCDGNIDEDAIAGAPCSVGIGACEVQGATVCGPDGEQVCDAVAGDPQAEVCNGVDDDCDGTTDEGFDLGDPCSGGIGRCAFDGATVCNAQGEIVCSDPGGVPVPEACNDFDDDCDGNIDEGFDTIGQACQVGVGICVSGGVNVCSGTPEQEALAFTGVRNDLTVAEAEAGGFELCWLEVYEEGQTTINNADPVTGNPPILGRCDEDVLLMGCRRIGSEALSVAAMGDRAEILEPTEFAERRPENEHNGVNWYFNIDYAWGFAPAGVEIDVFTCDRVENVASNQRVCWYTSDDKVRPGFRCGEEIVNASGIWERFIFHRSGTATDGAVGVAVCGADPLPPEIEACNTFDDDCDGTVDEGFDLGTACVSGIGGCAAPGQVICGLDGAATCSAEAAPPEDELCNGIDDDCDGSTDEDFALESDCIVGVGACQAEGEIECDLQTGEAVCDATPEPPGQEVCNAFDDDCDGISDEGVENCVVYPSCLAARQAGEVNSGIQIIQPDPGSRGFEVWCDQNTDGGGWTTVASSAVPSNGRGSGTMDDRVIDGGDYLSSLAPRGLSTGVWGGMLALGDRFDIRFACRDHRAGSSFDPMTVDLSFYDNGWYAEIVSGIDADSCFFTPDEPVGPPPARRNNLTGMEIDAGVNWGQGQLVAEDSCADGGDFIIDFNDGGSRGNRSDGTDWGEYNAARVCGTSNLATGQWMILVRETQ
ncbi:MAG: MopE-related protein [Bradymonadia bacterium]